MGINWWLLPHTLSYSPLSRPDRNQPTPLDDPVSLASTAARVSLGSSGMTMFVKNHSGLSRSAFSIARSMIFTFASFAVILSNAQRLQDILIAVALACTCRVWYF